MTPDIPDTMKHTYHIKGMHCEACADKIDKALRSVEGVESATVMRSPPRAKVQMNRHIDTQTLNQAVAESGDYSLSDVSSQSQQQDSDSPASSGADDKPESLYPLLLIVGFLTGTVLLIHFTHREVSWMDTMRHFMAGFFLAFSFFKLLDPPGFVSAYRGYDIIARRSVAWAWVYPVVELALGVAYLINSYPVIVNAITLLLMLIGAAGVLKALLDKRQIRCACLGTAINLPMTTVTLIEDLTMALMAAAMLIWYLI